MKEEFKVAIVGCGVIAQTHLHVLKKLGSLEVVAVCDTDKKKALLTAKKWGVEHSYDDFSKMLDREDISILSILTPPASHSALALEAIERGINLVIEKPFTATTREADSVVKALRASGTKLTVVYHYLFSKAMLKSLSLIKSRRIGAVLNADLNFVQSIKDDAMASDQNHWCHRSFGGRFGEMLPHPVYLMQSFLGDSLRAKGVWVSKRGNIPWMDVDELHTILESESGVGSLYISLNSPRVMYTCDVYGTREILKIDLTRQTVLRVGPREMGKFSIGRDCLSEACRLSLSTMENALAFSFRKQGESPVSKIYTTFADSIREGIEPPVTPRMACNTVRIVEEICKAIQTKVQTA